MVTTVKSHNEIIDRTSARYLDIRVTSYDALNWKWRWVISVAAIVAALLFNVNPGLVILLGLILFYLMEVSRHLLTNNYQQQQLFNMQEEIMDRTRMMTDPRQK